MAAKKKLQTFTLRSTVEAVAEAADVPKKEAHAVLTAFLQFIKDTCEHGDEVRFVGFGSFAKKHREARKGRNPQTGETIDLAASDSLAFHSTVKYK